MSYPPRRILSGVLYDVTARTFQGRYFFVPSESLNRLIAGAMAYAQKKYDVTLCGTAWMSNHAHHLVEADNETQIVRFFQLVHEQVAKEVQRFCKSKGIDWTGGIFADRPSIVPIEGGARIQRERLKYLLSQGVKEGLVPHPRYWPGVHCAGALLSGKMQIAGTWVDRTNLRLPPCPWERSASLGSPRRSERSHHRPASYVGEMSYPPRRILSGVLYDVTARTFQGRYFFVPSESLNRLIAGAMAYAQKKYDVTLCGTAWMSNHAHHLVEADNETQIVRFFQLVHEQVAKEVQRYCKSKGIDWTGGIFADRPSIVPIEGGARIQRERLKYLLSQGVKEGLVPHPRYWPGVHCAGALLSGKMQIAGTWVDRTNLYDVERGHRRRKKKVTRKRLSRKQLAKYHHSVAVHLSAMPYQAEMTEAERSADVQELINEILEENARKVAAAQRYRKQRKKRVTDQRNLTMRPKTVKKDVEPLVHADGYGDPDDHTWRMWMLEWESWLNAYRRASKRLRAGIPAALGEFPEGCFLPSLPRAALASLPPP